MRSALLVVFAALGLRVCTAVATQYYYPLPAYYTTDAAWTHDKAVRLQRKWREGGPGLIAGSPGQRLYVAFTAGLYRWFTADQLWPKLVSAFLGAASIGFFLLFARRLAGERPALLSAWTLALWPTHVFYTSQLFKDSFVLLGVNAALLGGVLVLSGRKAPLAMVAAGVVTAGLFRGYVGLALSLALAAYGLLAALGRRRAGGLLLATIALASAGLVSVLSKHLFQGALAAPPGSDLEYSASMGSDLGYSGFLLPKTIDYERNTVVSPFSPAGLARFRRLRHEADQAFAVRRSRRAIGTQIFYGEDFESWLDVAFFLPKGAFYVLFMPLPGLHELEGKPGRMVAAAENLLLLLLVVIGLVVAARALTAEAALALILFGGMTLGSALLEFDLGSATRHKLLYLPLLFPFALSARIKRSAAQGR